MPGLTPIVERATPSRAVPCASAGGPDAERLFALRDSQALLKARLAEPLPRLFVELTGLPLHIYWHPPWDAHPPGMRVLDCPATRLGQPRAAPLSVRCDACRSAHWDLRSLLANSGRRFIGHCRATNFCVTLELGGACPLTLAVQSRPANRPRSYPNTGRAPDSCDNGPRAVKHRHRQVGSQGFARAEALLRLISHDLAMTLDRSMAHREQTGMRRALQHLEAENTRLRRALAPRIPALHERPVRHACGNHTQRIVQAMLDYLQAHYERPMALRDVAADLGMNVSYLSALFSRTMGITFHRYLNELRLTRAEELLQDPRARICEVARAVGYTSPNHFREVFKHQEGIPPSAWNELPPTTGRK